MKKILLACFVLFLGVKAFSQCTPNTNYTLPGIYPDTLPAGTVGQAYSTDITFMMPLDTLGYPFLNFQIQTVTLPVGLTWICSNWQTGCNYDPQANQYGCVNVSGTPLLAGNYNIDVTVIADLSIASGIPVTFQIFMQVLPATTSSSNNGYSMTGYTGCSPITVNFTNNNPGLLSYFWDFGNSNQTTAENPVPQVYNQPGDYIVHYEAYSDTTTNHFYTLTDIEIASIQNSFSVWGYPTDGNPDLFVIVKENGNPVYQSSYFADQFPPVSWNGLNINMNPINTYVIEVWDEDDFEFGFGADDYVGNHTMSLNGCNGCAANISVINYSVNHTIVPPSPSVITDDTVHVYGFPGTPNIYYDSLNHVLHTDTIQYNLQWYLNGSPLLGSNAPTDTVLISGDYFVIAINSYGCAAFSDTITAIYCDTAWHPTVAYNQPLLSTIDTTNNTMQWYYNGNPIPGATAYAVNAAINGVYTLEITNEYGCTFLSAPQVINVGIAENAGLVPMLFPNPANQEVQIILPANSGNVQISIRDMSGRLIRNESAFSSSIKLNVADLASGTYLIEVNSNGNTGVNRLIIAR
jgi:Secretion system C-terminal sorting domain